MAESDSNATPRSGSGHAARKTPVAARGEPAVWLTGAALAVSASLIVALLAVIAWRGSASFVPRDIERVTLDSGETFFGQRRGDEIEPEGGVRTRFRVGNRDLGQESFRWVPDASIASAEPAPEAVLIERRQWGVFIGEPAAVLHIEQFQLGSGESLPEPADRSRVRTDTVDDAADGSRVLRRVVEVAAGDELDERLPELLDEAAERRAAIVELSDVRVPRLQAQLSSIGYRVRAAEIEHERTLAGEGRPWPVWAWAAAVFGCAGLFVTAVRTKSRGRVWRWAVWSAVVVAGMVVVLEHPWAGPAMSAERLAGVRAEAAERTAALEAERSSVLERIDVLREADARWRLEVIDPLSGRFAPRSQSEPGEPLRVSQVDRLVRPTGMGVAERTAVYFARWWDFLSLPPGEEPGTGGVYPVIVGTVTLTLLLTISVVPLGVIAAVYLREYAPQGVVTSAIRVAINNLAGVPSIVYGMFGLGFFCYVVGGYVDGGPGGGALPRGSWWGLAGVCALLVVGGGSLWAVSRSVGPGGSGEGGGRLASAAKWVAVLVWVGALVAAGQLIATTPYFNGFFAEKLPAQPTFGGRGILWASLTLALLTLPVVIVATEEAIAAVPGSMREGSYGCGASRWQTVRRIVLPSALPGIMTGAILAMARGAGEVAPLMLVGAVNLAPAPPVTLEAPFLHGDRTFMHLGFHIYNLGFQSPDAEAAEPLVWTTTLLLVSIVLVLNLVAVIVRARLRRATGAVV